MGQMLVSDLADEVIRRISGARPRMGGQQRRNIGQSWKQLFGFPLSRLQMWRSGSCKRACEQATARAEWINKLIVDETPLHSLIVRATRNHLRFAFDCLRHALFGSIDPNCCSIRDRRPETLRQSQEVCPSFSVDQLQWFRAGGAHDAKTPERLSALAGV